ncbi:choice-of-anchor J domain-containing protein [Ekhidna sp.]|uniref:T9SS-dependent choice-of-anchor J family protein n=1 Tax=Ekhidna sp. TaxID=2608089 RepID=UPI0032EAFBEA
MRSGLLFFLCLISLGSSAQERCGTIAPTTGEFENWISTKIAERKNLAHRLQAPLYQIPVVVHVFHKGEPVGTGVNLSEERIKAQIDSLTADFRRMNADAVNTPDEFLPVAADVEIEFVLAKQDPAGNPTNGIVRLRGSRDVYRANSHRPLLRSESYWPAEHYLNIVVTDLQVFLGYASFPIISLEGITNDTEDFIFDGVLIDYEYFGVNPSSPSFESYGRTLTHEVGHYLGLRHIWGDGNCTKDDFVDDTPLADNDNGDYTSPCTFPNPDDDEICVAGEPEMFQNYMDYTDDICMNLFTLGQKTRMRTVMDNAPNRMSLISSPGLSDPTRFSNDLAATAIIRPHFAECDANVSTQVIVSNYGINEVSSYDIQLVIDGNPEGTPQNITTTLAPLATDTISFGSHSISSSTIVSYEISNVNGGSDGNNFNNSIVRMVKSVTSQTLPFNEDFEGSVDVLGEYGPTKPWQVVNAPKSTPGNQAFNFKAYNNTEWFGEQTIFKTPILNLEGIASGDLRFSYAHANRPDAFYDGLMVKASLDCGETFPDIIFFGFGPNLATASENNNPFTPANQLEWIDTLISITEYRDIDGVQFAFVGINGSGNNIYVDDVQIVETNLFENDIKPLSLKGPLITCSESSDIRLNIRNVGSETITSFEVKYNINSDTLTTSFDNLSIESKGNASFNLAADNLVTGGNVFGIEITLVNGVADESMIENSVEINVHRDNVVDEYPLTVDFESTDNWVITADDTDTLFRRTFQNDNGVLQARGFNASDLGKTNWFISPNLNTGGLDSAGLYFRVSYASRSGFSDRLQVLLSTDCGETYNTNQPLLHADSDSLSITESQDKWVPLTDSDWKMFRIDLPHNFPDEELRIAFVFTPGGGNDLYIDDISIRGNEPPAYAEPARIFPNPSNGSFNLGLNLAKKESVTIRLLDMSGKIIFEERVDNALNQILKYQAPSQQGLYFLNIVGRQFNTSQKLFINR